MFWFLNFFEYLLHFFWSFVTVNEESLCFGTKIKELKEMVTSIHLNLQQIKFEVENHLHNNYNFNVRCT